MKVLPLTMLLALSLVLHARDVTTLDGEEYRAVEAVTRTAYTIKFQHEAGLATLPLANLTDADLAELAPADRSRDGRFWYERGIVLHRAWKNAGADPQQQAAMIFQPLAPYAPLIVAYSKEKAQTEAAQKAAAAKATAQDRAAREAVDEWNRQLVERYSTEAGIKELMQSGRR